VILIVGATGSLGGSVARELLQRGERVRAVARPHSPLRSMGRFTDPTELQGLGAQIVEADLRHPDSLVPHLEGVRAVLSTASGTKRGEPDTLQAVDLGGRRRWRGLPGGRGWSISCMSLPGALARMRHPSCG